MYICHYKDGKTINELRQPEFTELDNPEDITSLQIFKEGTFFTVSRLNNTHRLVMLKIGLATHDPNTGKESQQQTGHLIYCIHSPMGDAEGWMLDWANGVIQRIYFNAFQRRVNFEKFKLEVNKIRFGARPNLTITNFKQIVPIKEWVEFIEEEIADGKGGMTKQKIQATFIEDIPYWECPTCWQFNALVYEDCKACGTPRGEAEETYLNEGKMRIK